MAGTVPGARDIKSNYTDSILQKCPSRKEDTHVGQQFPDSEINRMMTRTLIIVTISLMFTLCLALDQVPFVFYSVHSSQRLNVETLHRPILQVRKLKLK